MRYGIRKDSPDCLAPARSSWLPGQRVGGSRHSIGISFLPTRFHLLLSFDDADALYRECTETMARGIFDQLYGNRDFDIEDCNG